MHERGAGSTFATARGVVQQWMDWPRAGEASSRFDDRYQEHALRHEAEMRAMDPDYDARQAGTPRAMGIVHVDIIRPTDPSQLVSIPTERDWSLMRGVTIVEVLVPDCSRMINQFAGDLDPSSYRLTVVNTHESGSRFVEHGKILAEHGEMDITQDPDDLDKDCYGPHPREALALLNPRCFFHGWNVIEERRTETTMLGCPADVLPLRRIIPLSDPRILGDEMNPTVFDETEDAEIVVDREHGVVLEWRGLLDGEIYERHFFSEIAFDVPVDPALFATPRDPDHVG